MTPRSDTSIDAARAQAKFLEGWSHHQKGRLDDAWRAYQEAIKLYPRHFNALHMAGIVAAQARRFDHAVELIGRALEVDPNNADAHFNRGNALRDIGQPAAAIVSFDKAIQLRADFADAHNNRGNALKDLVEFQAAVESYDKAIQCNPDFAQAHNNRGNALRHIQNHKAAVESCDKAIALKPDYTDAFFNRGLALLALKQHQAALDSHGMAIRLNATHAEAYHGRGQVLAELRQHQGALDHYDKAIRLKPDYVAAHISRGLALKELRQYDAALAAYGRAIQLKGDSAEAYNNRANLLSELKQYAAAIEDYGRALKTSFSYGLYGMHIHTKMQICDWQAHDEEVAGLLDQIAHGEKAAAPFPILMLTDLPAIHKRVAEIWAAEECPGNNARGPLTKRQRREKIRIGYFSMDFRNHPVAQLVVGLIEAHDRSRYEVYGLSFGPDTMDPMRARLMQAFDKFIDVRGQSDEDIAALARRLEIDIAVDLAGYTNGARTNIFAMRAAPIQVNYLGYPGTMGAAYYDYIVADMIVVPDEFRDHYDEKVAYLPQCYQANDVSRAVAERVFSREELGLPARAFVYCCFNNTFKIAPGMFNVWMRILKRVEGSVLWLLEDNPAAAANLRVEAERRGVAPERLVFAARAPQGEHLARHRAADLFLDTLPYNAHTTASDALWMGLPLLTCRGQSFAGQVAASILTAVDLPDMVTVNVQDYEMKAIALATEPALLTDVKRRLQENILTAPLFNIALYARHIEAAFASMAERYHAGLPPEDIHPARNAGS